jgi:arylsulfatase A-like enzyme
MPKGFDYSGEDMSKSLLGFKVQARHKDIMWDYGRNRFFGRPPQPYHQSPHLAIRRGDYKLLINSDKTSLELYNIQKDPNETVNIADKYPDLCREMSQKVINWYFTKRKLRQ